MTSPAAFAATAALLAEPPRAAMLQALLSGEALTAGELARVARQQGGQHGGARWLGEQGCGGGEGGGAGHAAQPSPPPCLLYTSDAADD